MIEEYYENKEAEQAREELLAAGARQSVDSGGRSARGARQISVSMTPLKSAIFGRWYDDVRPLLRRHPGIKAELPQPVYTEVP